MTRATGILNGNSRFYQSLIGMSRADRALEELRAKQAEQQKWDEFLTICREIREFFTTSAWDLFYDRIPETADAALVFVRAEWHYIDENF